jgi:predicted transport protein
MSDIQKAQATQVKNIESRTGKTLDQLIAHVKSSKISKHTEIVNMLKADYSLGFGDANAIAHLAKQSDKVNDSSSSDPLDELYVGPKAALRKIHDSLLKQMNGFGVFEATPKQKYVSYRRKKQFAMIGPATNTRVDLGLNIKELPDSPRLEKLPAGKMCNFQVKITDSVQVDSELVAWIKMAYDTAG